MMLDNFIDALPEALRDGDAVKLGFENFQMIQRTDIANVDLA